MGYLLKILKRGKNKFIIRKPLKKRLKFELANSLENKIKIEDLPVSKLLFFVKKNKLRKKENLCSKRLLRKPDSLLYSVKMLNKYFSFLGKRLLLYNSSKRLKKGKFVIIKLLHKMKRYLFVNQILRYFFMLCLRNILVSFKNSESILLFLKSFFSYHFSFKSKFFRCNNNLLYFF